MKRRSILLAILSSPLAWLGLRHTKAESPEGLKCAGTTEALVSAVDGRCADGLIQVRFDGKGKIANFDEIMAGVPFKHLYSDCHLQEISVWVKEEDAVYGRYYGKMTLKGLNYGSGAVTYYFSLTDAQYRRSMMICACGVIRDGKSKEAVK